MAWRKKRARTRRREIERELEKLEDDKEKLARLSEGGSAEWPFEVSTASLVEPRALALGCARCDGTLRLIDHAAVPVGGRVERRVRARCVACGTVREVWFHITQLN